MRRVFAHVWEGNGEALAWYESRGFVRWGSLVEGYYRRLRPAGGVGCGEGDTMTKKEGGEVGG